MSNDPLGRKADDVTSVIIEEVYAGEMPPEDLLRAVIERLASFLMLKNGVCDEHGIPDMDKFSSEATDLMKGAGRQVARAVDMLRKAKSL